MYKKMIPLQLLIVLCCAIAGKTQTIPGENPAPVLALIEEHPLSVEMKNYSPTLTLYNDGTLIYKKDVKKKEYQFKKLSPKEMNELLPGESFKKLQPRYKASDMGDQLIHVIIFWHKNERQYVNVYGDLREKDEDRKRAPDEFMKTYDKLVNACRADGEVWLPEYIEISIRSFDYSKGKTIQWPAGWPDINHPMTRQMPDGSYKIFLERRHYDEFIKMKNEMDDEQALLINNRKYWMTYRLPFPDEKHWMQ
jgi:hypothetical protein